MITYSKATIIEWIAVESEKPIRERILWIDQSARFLFVIKLYDKKALPVIRQFNEIEDALSDQSAVILPADPYAYLHMSDWENIEEWRSRKYEERKKRSIKKWKEIRDRAWQLIRDIVQVEPDIYIPSERGRLISQVEEQYGVHRRILYRYLRKYWQRGMIPNALLPDYRECGSPGEEKKADGEKRGRRRRQTKVDPDAVGINVDEETKKIIEMSKELFYDTKEKNPERRAYKLMIERFYTIGG